MTLCSWKEKTMERNDSKPINWKSVKSHESRFAQRNVARYFITPIKILLIIAPHQVEHLTLKILLIKN